MTAAAGTVIDSARIARVAAAVDVHLAPAVASTLADFGRLFLAWNERINLGGAISGTELIERHFLDSFAASRFVAAGSRVVDVGSGGGLPALPLAIVRPDLVFRLFEPTGKKVAFLRTAIRELGMKDQVEVRAERVQAGGPRGWEVADVATSRATLEPALWLKMGLTLVRPGGMVLVFGTGGPADPTETAEADWTYAPHRRMLVYRSRS